MSLRKCPSCKEIVGADSAICPRCGASFRAATMWRVFRWMVIAALVAWIVYHYVQKFRLAHAGS